MSIAGISNSRPTGLLAPLKPDARPAGPTGAEASRGIPSQPDEVSISAAGRRLAAQDAEASESSDASPGPKKPEQLSEKEKQEVSKLKARDQEVRRHEQAHIAALGGGSAHFTYEVGPDGRRYAVEGEVPVSIKSSSGDPQSTIREARKVAQAAVAPAQPSGADYAARKRALEVERKAREELREKKRDGDGESGAADPNAETTAAGGSTASDTGPGFDTSAVDSSAAAAAEALISTAG